MSSSELAELEEIGALIASGRHLGALTYGEVATAVAELDLDETDIEELHSFLEECEIELVDDAAPQPAAAAARRDQGQAGKPTTPLDLTPDTTTDSPASAEMCVMDNGYDRPTYPTPPTSCIPGKA
jgi:RNA polymerase primary sigma factor